MSALNKLMGRGIISPFVHGRVGVGPCHGAIPAGIIRVPSPRRGCGFLSSGEPRRLPLWASHRSKVQVGGCTDCALAATTARAFSVILWRGHEHEGSRSWKS